MNGSPRRRFALAALLLAVLLPAASQGAGKPFTIVVLPDTQVYTEKFPDQFEKQVDWIRRNVRRQNIAFVTHVGDIVQHGHTDTPQWEMADKAMSKLDGVAPWGVAIGNRDYTKLWPVSGERFIRHFGEKRFRKHRWFGDVSPNGINSYQLFEAGGTRFLIFHLECDVPEETMPWVKEVIRKHPDRAIILTTHIYLCPTGRLKDPLLKGRNSGEDIWNKLVK